MEAHKTFHENSEVPLKVTLHSLSITVIILKTFFLLFMLSAMTIQGIQIL